ncbi:MAG: ribonuclease HII [Bdellovibrionales bacterium RIFCSPHIGHO2_01_FULL_40_29]|nr:MAG: ribonuclease HII [Bdellovibrionales bacterium RIFCSPHIGHO2_01_FULL_40_29]OFZ32991.1 MAG: ribonuclease HII [Bdellovibrionales bacterium RIFCSPHIGHO2_02_FULL_40_15]
MKLSKAKLNHYLKSLPAPLVGIDEVGRGCLAGPVYAAAVCFKSEIDIKKYKDSKAVDEITRRKLSESVQRNHHTAIGIATVDEIDQFNILQATFIAMRRAVEQLAEQVDLKNATLLIDGRDKIPKFDRYNQLAIIEGDDKVRLISAASLVAKVARDQFMTDLAAQFVNYGFERHKGYATQFHRDQIQKFGPSEWHRQTFAGVREYC